MPRRRLSYASRVSDAQREVSQLRAARPRLPTTQLAALSGELGTGGIELTTSAIVRA